MKSPFSVYKQAIHTHFGCSFVASDEVLENTVPGVEFHFGGAVYQLETRADRHALAVEQTQYVVAAQQLPTRLLIRALEHAFPAGKEASIGFSLAITHVLGEQGHADPERAVNLLIGALDLLRERWGQPDLWADFAQVDPGITAAALVAAERSAELHPGQLANYLTELCFSQGQEYLVEPDGGLFVRLDVGGTDLIIYQVAAPGLDF